MRKPKGYWNNRENVVAAVMAVVEKEDWTEIPTTKEILKAGICETALRRIGGREGVANLTGLPLRKGNTPRREANMPSLEKWDGKPSKAFKIEAEARKVGLSYADIQKRKTLELVGGIQL
jgi:hypothetical protein